MEQKQIMAEEWAISNISMYLNNGTILDEQEIINLIEQVVSETVNHQALRASEIDTEKVKGTLVHFLRGYREYNAEETVMLTSEENIQDWAATYQQNNKWERWRRLRNYFIREKNRTAFQINRLNTISNQILTQIGDPRLDSFDKRGLVVGYVQSGKTENYIGLANKAIDAGYKLVIILSGVHNDLRSQTQTRVDEEVIGIDTELLNVEVGVGLIKELHIHPVTRRTKDGDISSAMAKTTIHQVINKDTPTVIVTKKVAPVLEALKEILSRIDKNLPILIIDDEADQASIDVKNNRISRNDSSYEPSSINKLIREIFVLFNKRSYVGYTATPFANVLIDHHVNHPVYGPDLFPKDFIIDLPKNGDYLGPDELFGFKDGEGLPLIRSIDDPDNAEEEIYEHNRIPLDMSNAIKSFIISTAVRHLRGQVKEHNSMLIHINRSVDSHDKIAQVVRDEFMSIKEKLEANDVNIINDFQEIWKQDYVPTSLEMQIFNEIEPWSEVINEITHVTSLIKIMIINGDSNDSLDYRKYVDEGLNVIAIGGDKLSRGLTLEGLTVSYYLRSSQTYDTLMQMGRWFGYKKDFEDLCRIFISPDLVSDFRAIAFANQEFRELVKVMQKEKKKPIDFGLRIRSHSVMDVTSILKLRSASTSLEMKSYAGRKPQTIFFNSDSDIIESNYASTVEFLESLPKTYQSFGSKDMIRLWTEIEAEQVIDYLGKLDMPEDITFGSPEKWLQYINHEINERNFENFRVFLMSNQFQGNAETIAGYVCNRPGRRQYETDTDKTISIGILRSGNDLNEISSYLSEDLSEIEEPILLIYPIVITKEKEMIKEINQKIIGLSIVFPESETQDLEYTLNTVEALNN